jgi:hypothetical protein
LPVAAKAVPAKFWPIANTAGKRIAAKYLRANKGLVAIKAWPGVIGRLCLDTGTTKTLH